MEAERDEVAEFTAAAVSSARRIIVDDDDSQKPRRTSDEQGNQPDIKAEDSEKGRPQSPTDSQKTVSDDEEIDYSVKPEFYDPTLDEKDELWVHKRRKGQYSDAVLSCPACFTTLSIECQRHERYVTQYRAIFVTNCKISTDETSPSTSIKRARGKEEENPTTVVPRMNPLLIGQSAALYVPQRLESWMKTRFTISSMPFPASADFFSYCQVKTLPPPQV